MSNNNKRKAPPLSRDKRPSKRTNDSNQRWERVKLDAFRIYKEDDQTLEDTRAKILEIHGFQACPRSWKARLNKWGYEKNIRRRDMQIIVAKVGERRQEGKKSRVCHGDKEVTERRIKNFVRRGPREVLPPIVATPPNTTVDTPRPSSEGPSEKMQEEFMSYPSPLSQLSVANATIGSLCSEIENSLDTVRDMPEAPPISMLDRYLSDKTQPWSQYHLSHALDEHQQILVEATEFFDLSNERNASPEPFRLSNQLLLHRYAAIDNEPGDDTFEAGAWDDLSRLVTTLAKYQNEHGEFASSTLKLEFELAKAFERNGNYEKAEQHCCRILDHGIQIEVNSFLGMILANTSRLEESTILLFSALAYFIVEFTLYSADENFARFGHIEALFTELVRRSEQDWACLSSAMCQMIATIRNAISEGTLDQIFPQLFIDGFSIADECSALGINRSANYMFNVLLESWALSLDDTVHGIEKAEAHEKYGLHLRREERWKSSAEQLCLAFESAINSGTYDSQLHSQLESDFDELLPHLATDPNDEDSVAERIREKLNRYRHQNIPHVQEASAAVQGSRIEEYFQSDLPIHFSTFEPSAVSHVAQFGLGDRTSSASLSASISYRFGVSASISDIMTGISDSISAWIP